jgi:hypothetical protein
MRPLVRAARPDFADRGRGLFLVVQASEVPTDHRSYALGRASEGEIQCLISWFVVHARKNATKNHHEFRKQTECVGAMHVNHVITFGSIDTLRARR